MHTTVPLFFTLWKKYDLKKTEPIVMSRTTQIWQKYLTRWEKLERKEESETMIHSICAKSSLYSA